MSDEFRNAYGTRRMTGPRRVIARAVSERGGAFTVEELAASVRKADPAAGATATVYRAIAAMEGAGYVERVGTRAGSALYVRCGAGAHHHHIVCDGCGRTAPTECPVVAEPTAPRADGFVVTRHEVMLYGLCPRCAGKKAG